MPFFFFFTAKSESIKADMTKNQLKYFLAGFFVVNGIYKIYRESSIIRLSNLNATIIKEIYKKVNKLLPEIKTTISVLKEKNFKNTSNYFIEIDPGNLFFEMIFGFQYRDVFSNLLIPKQIEKDDNFKYFVNGIFVANGSVSRPNSKYYHLEFSLNNLELANVILKRLKKYFPNFKILQRKNKCLLYIKKANDVSDFIKFINAPNMVILFEDSRISRDFMNSINRLNNFDIYNQEKTNSAFLRHYEIIKTLKSKKLIYSLDEKYQNFIKIRIEHKEASLDELAIIINEKYKYNITKSGINHWLRHLKKVSLS